MENSIDVEQNDIKQQECVLENFGIEKFISTLEKRVLKNRIEADKSQNYYIFNSANNKNSLIHQQNKQLDNEETVFVVDRFEGNIAICENRETQEMINVNLDDLPKDAKEGDVLIYKNNCYELDYDKRNEIEERIKEKLRNIFDE